MSISEKIAKKAEQNTGSWDAGIQAKTITMEKVTKDERPKRLGSIEDYTYKSLNEDQARQRAVRALKRIGEDPLHWKVLP